MLKALLILQKSIFIVYLSWGNHLGNTTHYNEYCYVAMLFCCYFYVEGPFDTTEKYIYSVFELGESRGEYHTLS